MQREERKERGKRMVGTCFDLEANDLWLLDGNQIREKEKDTELLEFLRTDPRNQI